VKTAIDHQYILTTEHRATNYRGDPVLLDARSGRVYQPGDTLPEGFTAEQYIKNWARQSTTDSAGRDAAYYYLRSLPANTRKGLRKGTKGRPRLTIDCTETIPVTLRIERAVYDRIPRPRTAWMRETIARGVFDTETLPGARS
jgi:hypothetical protein